MAHCTNCGNEVGDEDRFCERCGQTLKPRGLSPEASERHLLTDEIRDTALRARATTISLGIVAGFAVIAAVSTVLEINLIERVRDGVASKQEIDANDARQAAIALARSVVQLATIVLWLRWQHRSQTNLRLRRPDARYTPGWAVGWWFIPIANLVMPYRTMRELWQGSHSDGALTEPSTRVSLWWVALLAMNSLGVVATQLASTNEIDSVALSARFLLASELVAVVAALLAISLVNGITRGQLTRRAIAV
jgi:hypothetical protein